MILSNYCYEGFYLLGRTNFQKYKIKEYKNRNNINTGQSSNWNVKSRDNGVSPF